jgi:hypothetical protein
MHRQYSELMGLSHHPFRLADQSCDDIKSPTNSIWAELLRDQAKVDVYNARILFLRATLGDFFAVRRQFPIYHPNGFGVFHSADGGEEWVVTVSNQMNKFQAAPEEVKRRIKKAMLSGEDTRSWWAHDPRELGPLMAALEGYHSKPATPAVSENYGEDGSGFIIDELRALHAIQFEEELGRLSCRLRKAATLPGVAEAFLEASKDSVGKTYPLFSVEGDDA